ncbi:hypothetical protein AAC387_Pa07g0585 [Persea americana]
MTLNLNLAFFRSQPFLSPNPFFQCRPSSSSSLIPLFSTLNPPKTLTLEPPNPPYGPSLHKGVKPAPSPPNLSSENEPHLPLFDRRSFSRAFDIAALRVPADQCFALESRLRGHLLNWPRVRNIARVPGDEIAAETRKILPLSNVGDDDDVFEAVNRRIGGKLDEGGDGDVESRRLSPVLYREKLMKSFNSRGFLKFRNLAKISRPKKSDSKKKKKKKKKTVEGEGEGEEEVKRIGKNDFVVVEVVGEESDEEDLSGLLGDDFKGGRWRGSTRLLLLDERYANIGVEELPEAVKAVLKGDVMQSRTSGYEIVQCKLTLFYNYWQMSEILEAVLPKGMIIPSAFETVGHIAHLNLRDEHLPYKKVIAQVVLDKNRPKIQTVVNKIDSIQNDYRTMHLEVLAGNHSLVTTVVENGIRFNVDLATVYWNSRLATERQRLVNSFTSKDVICDVFSGVGPIAISAAKKVKYVYANDLNPHAVEYLERNVVLNKLDRKIEVFNMDGRRFVDAVFSSQRVESITQVVMNLPNDAVEYLDAFWGVFRGHPKTKHTDTTLPKIHVYGFSKAQDPEFDFHERINTTLSELAMDVEMHRVRLVAPGKWMLCASFVLPERVAFAKRS